MFQELKPFENSAQLLKKYEFTTKNDAGEEIADEEVLEVRRNLKMKTGYPRSERSFRMDLEGPTKTIDEPYFWYVGHMRNEFGMPIALKITDTHSASAASSVFGDMQTRLGAQQSNVSNYMGMMGKLLKDLFQLVRELRQIDERLDYYKKVKDTNKSREERSAAESTLKDIYVTLVEGGTQSPSSVYGMAQRVGFTVLPDLYFAAPLMPFEKQADEIEAVVDKHVESLDFNEAVKSALRRKLYQFAIWKKETYKELVNKREFQIRYLRQHFEVIRMYMNWIKPYLKNIKRLQMNQEKADSVFVINSLQTSYAEIEVLMARPLVDSPETKNADIPLEGDAAYSVVLATFQFISRPHLAYNQPDSYSHRGPQHMGRVEITVRAYGWTSAQIKNYQKYREAETMDMIEQFDTSVKESMEYLGESLEKYLKEAEATIPKNMFEKKEIPKEEKKEQSTLDLLTGPFAGMYELLVEPFIGKKKSKKSGPDNYGTWLIKRIFGARAQLEEKEKTSVKSKAKKAIGYAQVVCYQTWKNYKKSHKLVSW